MIRPRYLLLLAAVALGACKATDSLDPAASVLSDQGLRVTLTIEPKVIDAPGKAVARLTYKNASSGPLLLESGASCFAFGGVYRGEKRIPFPRSDNPGSCT